VQPDQALVEDDEALKVIRMRRLCSTTVPSPN
jgi:hypothetical protein